MAVCSDLRPGGDATPLEEVWLLYTAQVEHGDFLRLLFQFGSRGALRRGTQAPDEFFRVRLGLAKLL